MKHCKEMLIKGFGFLESNITVLLESASSTEFRPTATSIRRCMHELVENTNAGDVLFLHYSGHGSQVPEPNEPDGLSEVLLPMNYLVRRQT